MRINSRLFSVTALASIAIGFMTAGCMEDNPIDYTTGAVAVGDGSQQSDVALDTEAPIAVSMLIDNGATSTSNTTVTLDMSATDDVAVTDYYASESAATPQASDSGWQSYQQSKSFTLSGSNSLGVFPRTVYVWFKDAAGNVSSNSVSDSINLGVHDTTAPTAVSVSISQCKYFVVDPGAHTTFYEVPQTGGTTISSGATAANTSEISSSLISDGKFEVLTFPNPITFPSAVHPAFDTSTTAGYKGHPILGPVVCENSGTTTNSTLNIILSATDDVAVTHYFASESAVTPQAEDSGWDNYSMSVSYSFDNDSAGTKTIYAWFKDAAGNISEGVTTQLDIIREPINGKLSGVVFEPDILYPNGYLRTGGPLPGVTVTAYGLSTITDVYGAWSINNISIPDLEMAVYTNDNISEVLFDGNIHISFEKLGYQTVESTQIGIISVIESSTNANGGVVVEKISATIPDIELVMM